MAEATPLEPHDNTPWIGSSEQRLFAIENTRERADRLKERLTPKLEFLRVRACELLREVYGRDALLPYKKTATPAHRAVAKKTLSFEWATTGLTVKGHPWRLQQMLECTPDGLHAKLLGRWGEGSNPLVRVLQRHSEEVIRLLEHGEFAIESSAIETSNEAEEPDLAEIIRKLRFVPDKDWEKTYIIASPLDLPIQDLDAAWPVIHDFITLFPIFRAATDVLQGEEDRFPYYAEQFWRWHAQLEDDEGNEPPGDVDPLSIHQSASASLSDALPEGLESALEGGFEVVFRRHRLREKRLRKWKLREVLGLENGRLRCEVPSCGFDFLEVYGELGRDYAEVHHKKPLSDRTRPERTKLRDLAIVCANCHAMIHRGKECRALEGLMPHRE